MLGLAEQICLDMALIACDIGGVHDYIDLETYLSTAPFLKYCKAVLNKLALLTMQFCLAYFTDCLNFRLFTVRLMVKRHTQNRARDKS